MYLKAVTSVANELSDLSQEPQRILVEPQLALWLPFAHPCSQRDQVQANVARRVTELQSRLVTFIRGVTRHQRHAATHILVTINDQSV